MPKGSSAEGTGGERVRGRTPRQRKAHQNWSSVRRTVSSATGRYNVSHMYKFDQINGHKIKTGTGGGGMADMEEHIQLCSSAGS